MEMPTLQEMMGWSENEVQAQIQRSLPKGWSFDFEDGGGFWVAEFRNADGDCIWQSDNPAINMLLFEAYGWLWLKHHPVRRTSAWAPRTREVQIPVMRSADVPDPEDLDPAEVTAEIEKRENGG